MGKSFVWGDVDSRYLLLYKSNYAPIYFTCLCFAASVSVKKLNLQALWLKQIGVTVHQNTFITDSMWAALQAELLLSVQPFFRSIVIWSSCTWGKWSCSVFYPHSTAKRDVYGKLFTAWTHPWRNSCRWWKDCCMFHTLFMAVANRHCGGFIKTLLHTVLALDLLCPYGDTVPFMGKFWVLCPLHHCVCAHCNAVYAHYNTMCLCVL